MKLEMKHLAPYLSYNLRVARFTIDDVYKRVEYSLRGININEVLLYNNLKPILRPLEDFCEEIDGVSLSDMITHGYHNEFWWKDNFKVEQLMYRDFELLVSKHADVFGLIDKGLAIDIKTLK